MRSVGSDHPFDSYRGLAEWSGDAVRPQVAVIIGCGALGSFLAEALAAIGVGRILLIDDDIVKPPNRPRMALVTPADVGSAKVDAVAAGLKRRFGDLSRVIPLAGSVETTLGIGLARRASFVFLCADNRAARRHGCRAARVAGSPHISGAIDGFFGMVSGVFAPPDSACYECTLNARERADLLTARFSCGDQPVQRAPSVPTTPLAATITAAWMTVLMLRFLRGEREEALARRVFINPLRHAVQAARFQRRADCTCASEPQAVAVNSLAATTEEMTPRMLLREARNLCGSDASVVLDYALVTGEVCRRCGYHRSLDSPRHEAAPSVCPACPDAPMTAVAWATMINEEHRLADHSFARLRLPWLHGITVCGNNGTHAFELSGDAWRLGFEEG